MLFEIIFFGGIGLALILAIVVGFTMLIVGLATGAVVFSRIAFSLFLGLAFCQSWPLLGSWWGNFLLWSVIVFAAIMLLSLMPRVNFALKFFCTSIICYLAVDIAVMLLGSFFFIIVGKQFEPTVTLEIVIKVLCTLISFGALLTHMEGCETLAANSPVARILHRLIASVLYGAAITFQCAIVMNGVWSLAPWINWCIFGGTAVAAYVADLFLLADV